MLAEVGKSPSSLSQSMQLYRASRLLTDALELLKLFYRSARL
jgi:hypothetical protein